MLRYEFCRSSDLSVKGRWSFAKRIPTPSVSMSGFEQFYRVAERVLENYLRASDSFDNVVAEMEPRGGESLDLCGQIGDWQSNAVPAARQGLTAIWHGTSA